MRSKLDWISFTLPIETDNSSEGAFNAALEDAFNRTFNEYEAKQLVHHTWVERKGRAPYIYAWDIGASGMVCFASPKRKEILIEISGKGCDYLRSVGVEAAVLEKVQSRLTRLDIATDIETHISPVDFVAKRTGRKSRFNSVIQSDTGTTVYVGSRESESYTRVYRYAEPHPRAALLRVEYVFRRKHARLIASEIMARNQ